MSQLTPELRLNYVALFKSCQCLPQDRASVLSTAAKIVTARKHYDAVSAKTGVPWFVVGALHNMEASLSFKCHLHNGDPLIHRTVHVPKGRPTTGQPPFTWVASAVDALEYDGLSQWTDWGVSGCLYRMELFNGWGYRTHGVNSPYLWGASNHQQPGKYVSDGVWSSTAVTHQIGCATLLHTILYTKDITLEVK